MSKKSITKNLLKVTVAGVTALQLATIASPAVTVFAETPKAEATKPADKGQTKETTLPDGSKQTRRVEKIPFNTKYTTDDNLEFGKEKEIQPGIEGEKEYITTVKPGTKEVIGRGQGTIAFTTKAPVGTVNENQIDPLTTVHVMDYSSSYAGKLKDSLRLSKKIIEANNNPDSKHIFQTYPQNYNATYAANVGDNIGGWGVSSKLMTKQEALSLIDKLLAINAPSEKNPTFNSYDQYFDGVAKAFGNLRYTDANAETNKNGYKMVPFEDIVNKLVKPTDTVSVIQYTDGWMDGKDGNGRFTPGTEEEIDKTFADWAKKRAKTFMSVINRNKVTEEDTNSDQSLTQMRAVGHPNIYDLTGKDPKVAETEIIKQFLETATVKSKAVKGENQTAHVVIGGNGIKVTKATLKGAQTKELPIKDGKVDYSEKLADGSYTVEFQVEGNGTASASVTVAGKPTDMKQVAVKSTAGTADKTTNEEKVVKEPQDRIIAKGTKGAVTEKETEKVPFETKYIEDDNLEEGKEEVRQEGFEGENEIIKVYVTKNGQKVGEPQVNKSEVKKPQDKIIAKGTKGSVTEKETEKIPFETEYIEDDNLEFGKEEVRQEGIEGEKEFTKVYTTIKGKKTGEPKVTEAITKEAQKRIIAKGTKGAVSEKETEKIPFETEYIEDPNLEYGKEEVRQEGVEGEKEITKTFATKNGEKVGEPQVTEKTTKEPQKRIIAKGTKKELPKKELPKTSDASPVVSALAGLGFIGSGIGAFFKRKKK